MTAGSQSGKLDRDGGYALRGQSDGQINISQFLGPGLRFLPQSGSRLELFNLRGAQVFRFSHGLPKPAWIGVIFVDPFDPGGARRRRARQSQIQQFRLDRKAGHGKVGHYYGCSTVLADYPCIHRRVCSGDFQ